MIFGGEKATNLNKKLPSIPTEDPPPYVYYATAPSLEPSDDPTPLNHPSSSFPAPPGPPPCNFTFAIQKHDSIKGVWNIDPSLPPPPSFLFASMPDAERDPQHNLFLKTTHGGIEAEVSVMNPKVVPEKGASLTPIKLECKSTHGKISMSVLSYPNEIPTPLRAPFYINTSSTHGNITLTLPRSFKGLIRSSTKHGKLILSDELASNSTTFSVNKGVTSTFVGDWRTVDFSSMGDQAAFEGMMRMDGLSVKSGMDLSEGLDGWPVDLCVIHTQHAKMNLSYPKS